ncbi:MAG: VanW family protein [Roseiflexaceae bacterium]
MSAEQIYPQGQPPADPPLADTRPPRTTRVRPPRHQIGSTILLVVLSLMLVLTLVVGGGLLYLDRSYAGKIYPNVTIQGLAVGEMTPQEAEAALRARYGIFLSKPATITYGDQTWQPTLGELGMQFDFSGAVDQAYQLGRGNGMFANAQEVIKIWREGLDLPLRITYDESITQQYIAGLAEQINIEPADATIAIEDAAVTTSSARIGRQLEVNSAVSLLSNGLRIFQPTEVDLNARELTPGLLDTPVRAAANQLQTMLSGPLEMTVGEQSFVWQPSDIAAMIEIARVPSSGGDTIAVRANPYAIERLVKQIADSTEIPGTRPRLQWENGQLSILKPGENGLRVDEARARDIILDALSGGARAFELPMRETLPPINETNLNTLGITDLVAIGKSDFTGSASYRVHNIGVGMNILNGILIAPSEEFSFNENIGNIDASQGFVEGAAIVQNRTQQEFGGGICQDSTTLFRAAFWAGLPITERWGHSFYINWYDKYALGPLGNGPGLDATIFTGGPDLKFVNDTGAWLLIQSWSNPKSGIAQVELYGTKVNRRVELTHRVYDRLPAPTDPVFVADPEQPAGSIKQSDRARGGMTIEVVRTVYVDGVARDPDMFRTRFRPWPNIFVLNPADMGPDGKPAIGWTDPNAPVPTPAPAPADPNTPAPTDPNIPAAPAEPAPATGEEPATSSDG